MEAEILILEDDILYAKQLELITIDLGYRVLNICQDKSSAQKALNSHLPDLLLIDINLESSNEGLEFAKSTTPLGIPIIFITQYADEFIYEETKKIANSSFLVKPFHKFSLKRQIETLLSFNFSLKSNEKLFTIRNRKGQEVVNLNDILWLETDGNYCIIQTIHNRYTLKKSLALVKKNLTASHFVQISRFNVVQIKYINKIDFSKSIVWVKNTELPIGRSFIKKIKAILYKIG